MVFYVVLNPPKQRRSKLHSMCNKTQHNW